VKFQATILQSGKTATGIVVPPDIVEDLGAGKKPPVSVTINGYTYRTSIAVMGGDYMIPVSAEIRAGAGIAGGDEVDVEVEVDTQPREVVVPADFTEALALNGAANTFFNGLSYSNKRRFVLSIEDAKTLETRLKRIEKSIGMLQESRAQ